MGMLLELMFALLAVFLPIRYALVEVRMSRKAIHQPEMMHLQVSARLAMSDRPAPLTAQNLDEPGNTFTFVRFAEKGISSMKQDIGLLMVNNTVAVQNAKLKDARHGGIPHRRISPNHWNRE